MEVEGETKPDAAFVSAGSEVINLSNKVAFQEMDIKNAELIPTDFPPPESPTSQRLSPDRCLICCNFADIDTNEAKSKKLPLDQLNDLLKVFKISSSFGSLQEHVPAPSKLFCVSCSKYILEASEILCRIECLQKDLKAVGKILKDNLVNTWVTQKEVESDWARCIRKGMVQCFSDCEVVLQKGPGSKVTPLNHPKKTRSEKIEHQLLYQSSRANSRNIRTAKRSVRKGRNTTFGEGNGSSVGGIPGEDTDDGDDYLPSASDEERIHEKGEAEAAVSIPSEKRAKIKGGRRKTFGSVLQGRIGKRTFKKSANRIYDDNGITISFDCPSCEKIFLREDYRTESGEYLFTCYPECCEKRISTFNNLILHHQSFCPAKPQHPKLKKWNNPAHVNRKVNDIKIGLKYNDRHMVTGFECPLCQTKMSPSDFMTESGKYIFKCPLDSCETTTRTFFNLAYHHHTHCSGRPRAKPKWRSSHKWRSPGSELENENVVMQISIDSSTGGNDRVHGKTEGMELTDEAISTEVINSSTPGNGRQYDKRGRIVSFECPHCQNKMAPADFVDTSTNTYVFKCSPLCCGRDFSTFPNFITHHESRCRPFTDHVTKPSDDPLQSGTVKKKKKNKIQVRTLLPLHSFTCKHCHKDYRRGEVEKEVSPGKFKFNCDIPNCEKSFLTFPNFKRHHEATCPEKPSDSNMCEHCGKKCQNAQILKNHLASFHTGEYKYVCDQCGVGLVSKQALSRHMLTHISERKFNCSHCSATFKRKDHLINHERRHQPEPAFMCGTCGKTFSVREGLRQHEVNFHGQGEFSCPICKKTFKSISYVRHHIWATHKGSRKTSKGSRRNSSGKQYDEVQVEAIEILPDKPIKIFNKGHRSMDPTEGSRIEEEDIMAVNSLLSMTTVEIA